MSSPSLTLKGSPNELLNRNTSSESSKKWWPRPKPRTGKYILGGLELILEALEKLSDPLPPLKSAIGAIAVVADVVKVS